jgi:hypothetical protein
MADNAESLFPYLMEHKPASLRIIGGIGTGTELVGTCKTCTGSFDFTHLGSVEGRDGWAYLAHVAQYVTRITGNKTIMLQNESALWRFHAEEPGAAIDFDALAARLQLFNERGIKVWTWLPAILSDRRPIGSRRHVNTTAFVKAWNTALPDSVFIGYDTMWHGWKSRRHNVANRDEMIGLVGRSRLCDKLLVAAEENVRRGGGRRFYTPEEAIAEMARLNGDQYIVYPGVDNWIPVATAFAELAGAP